jgi:hypothetical protein
MRNGKTFNVFFFMKNTAQKQKSPAPLSYKETAQGIYYLKH